jgi:hypothetical protein
VTLPLQRDFENWQMIGPPKCGGTIEDSTSCRGRNMQKITKAMIAATLLANASAPTAAYAGQGETVYVYCLGDTTSTSRPKHAYVSYVFEHEVESHDQSLRLSSVNSDFREDVLALYDDPIGADCFWSDRWDAAEDKRDIAIRNRRNNGWTFTYVD